MVGVCGRNAPPGRKISVVFAADAQIHDLVTQGVLHLGGRDCTLSYHRRYPSVGLRAEAPFLLEVSPVGASATLEALAGFLCGRSLPGLLRRYDDNYRVVGITLDNWEDASRALNQDGMVFEGGRIAV